MAVLLYLGFPLNERVCVIVLDRDDNPPLLVDESPFVVCFHRGQSFGEGECGIESRLYGKISLFINEAIFVVYYYCCHSFGELDYICKRELRTNNDFTSFVYKSAFSIYFYGS